MKKLFTNRKFLAALAALLLATAGVLFGTDVGIDADTITGVVCQVVECN